MKNKILVAVIVVLVCIIVALSVTGKAKLGGVTNYDSLTLTEDLTVGDDVTISGGALSVTTAANATSSITVGCITTYATSSVTAVKQVFTTTGATSTFNGTVYWNYGVCP